MSDVKPTNPADGFAIPVRFTRLYITLLAILTVLFSVGQGLTQWRLGAVQDELWVIRYAALQRHQSQQIVKQVLQLTDTNEQANFSENIADLRKVVPAFERYHLQGREGRVYDRNVAISNSKVVQRLYDEIRPEFDAFRRSAHRLMRMQSIADVEKPDVQASVRLMLANEKPFLEEIDGIVREYVGELRAKLALLQKIEFYLYVFTMLMLVGIGLLIFQPAARKLKQTFAQLVEAESQTAAVNKKLLSVNKSLRETRQKLFEATKQQYQRQIDDQKIRTSYLVAGQEEERKRLSRELHDGLGQMLTAIKLQIEGLEAKLSRAALAEEVITDSHTRNLKTLKTLVTQTIQETRTISNNLMPSVLSDFGIVPAIKMLAEHDRSETVDVTFVTNLTSDMARLDKDVEIMLYRVTQESISNAIRHAKPSHIQIELFDRGNTLQLLITDDGCGFQTKRKRAEEPAVDEEGNPITSANQPVRTRTPSQGLHNMQERVKLVNGKFKLHSAPGKGTKIQVSIPYHMQSVHHDTN